MRVGQVLVGMVMLAAAAPAWADDASMAGDKAEIQLLKARLDKLERKVSDQASSGASGTSDAGAAGISLPSGIQDLAISGYVDAAYGYNFNRPDTGAPARTNRGRVFDTNPNSFTLHAAKIALEKPLSDGSPVGFRTDLMFGDDAELIHSTGLGNAVTGDNPIPFDLEQAYVSARAPIGSGVDFKVGKFVTLLGAEVIESPANWNYSRSYLFGFAIPFTHTGALASYSLGDIGSTSFGIVNGWDLADENNSFKTMLGNLTLTPIEGVTLATNLITGAERASDNQNDRTVLDLVGTWQPMDALTLMANLDFGHEGSITHGGTTPGSDTGNWNGVALYAKYNLSDTWSLAGRWETFNDQDDVRTALTGPSGGVLEGLRLYDYTLTSQWELSKHMLARLEYRHDLSNERVFFHKAALFKTAQDTVAAEFITRF